MDKKWIDRQYDLLTMRFVRKKLDVIKAIEASGRFRQIDKEYLITKIRSAKPSVYVNDFSMLMRCMFSINGDDCVSLPHVYWRDSMETTIEKEMKLNEMSEVTSCINNLNVLKDSDWVEFKGDIVITDPCYTTDRWGKFELSELPMCRGTIYGDWSCTTYDLITNESIGRFCADTGLVCVDTLDNILARKPDFLEETSEHTRTIIKDFDGKVRFQVVEISKPADNWKVNTWNYEVRVVGEGVNTVTGRNIHFITTQTGV